MNSEPMTVWIVEASQTSFEPGENDWFIFGVYATEELGIMAGESFMEEYPGGQAISTPHEVRTEV